jgi:hypothetical protein
MLSNSKEYVKLPHLTEFQNPTIDLQSCFTGYKRITQYILIMYEILQK